MDRNASAFPQPPYYYKQKLSPPKPPEEGEFSMFGRTYTTKETPLRIEIPDFHALISDADLQDPLFFQRDLLYKFQSSLMNTAQLLIKSLAENPSEAINRFKDYEKIILNFSQLIYWMRPLQALLEVKSRLVAQTETKEKLRSELISMLHQLKIDLNSVINL